MGLLSPIQAAAEIDLPSRSQGDKPEMEYWWGDFHISQPPTIMLTIDASVSKQAQRSLRHGTRGKHSGQCP